MKTSILGAVLAILVAATGRAQPAAGERDYVISVASPGTAGAAEVAADVARIHGGTVVRSGEGKAIVRVSEARESLLAADPRISDVTPIGDESEQILSGETMPWSAGVAYQYDGGGNVRQIGSDVHAYDVVGRLVLSRINGVSRNYEYDAFGNRMRCVHAMGTSSESDCQALTIHSATNKIAGTGRYDEAGNVISLPGFSYEYDPLNMMVEAQAGSMYHEFVYTADDERIASYVANTGVWAWTVRGFDGKPLREFTSGNNSNAVGTAAWQWRRDYVWRDSLLLASRQPNGTGGTTTYHYHLDHLGTPRRVTDGTDSIVGSHDYYAFGAEQTTNANEPSPSSLKYTGHERDTYGLDALDYMHARYYGPGVGRFLSVDPTWASADLGKPQSWNRYSYVLNNPINYTDPDGRCTAAVIDCVIEGGSVAGPAGAVIGAVVGGAIVYGGSKVNWRAVGEWFASGGGSSGEVAAERMIQNWSNHMAEQVDLQELPARDATGKIHTNEQGLPTAEDLQKYPTEELQHFQDELKGSVGERIKTTSSLPDQPKEKRLKHGERQAEEQRLIKAIDKILKDRE